ncbi:MAG: hypothetical protein DCF16_05230 [Alphaproteobacteria bacterium]|nr:MAG: hypothetical protein DCF16_05230 [Alphaproteobacteria bacterium]
MEATRAGFELRRTPSSAAADWALSEGALQHRSKGFFSVNGVRDGDGEAVLLYQPQAAVTGLLTAELGGERLYLLQARAEPGCLGEVQFGPTVQSTPANFMRLHGGAPTPNIDAFIAYEADARPLQDTTQLDLGERYLFKSKRSLLVETAKPMPAAAPFVWTSAKALRQAAGRSAFLNLDLRSILSLAPWTEAELAPKRQSLRASLVTAPRPEVLGSLLAKIRRVQQPPSIVRLEHLKNWVADEWGWSERESQQGFRIGFFEVSAAHREVKRWVQPLVDSSSEGHVALACRDNRGVFEVLVCARRERGLATDIALAPTYVRYPGAPGALPAWLNGDAHVLSATVESDEGGRFYRDVSRYELVLVEEAPDGYADCVWLNVAELKLMLTTSNLCTIQLRAIVSQLLAL